MRPGRRRGALGTLWAPAAWRAAARRAARTGSTAFTNEMAPQPEPSTTTRGLPRGASSAAGACAGAGGAATARTRSRCARPRAGARAQPETPALRCSIVGGSASTRLTGAA